MKKATGKDYEAEGSHLESLRSEINDSMLSMRKEMVDHIRQIDDKIATVDALLTRIEKKVGQ